MILSVSVFHSQWNVHITWATSRGIQTPHLILSVYLGSADGHCHIPFSTLCGIYRPCLRVNSTSLVICAEELGMLSLSNYDYLICEYKETMVILVING
jgi:hypothetical protein